MGTIEIKPFNPEEYIAAAEKKIKTRGAHHHVMPYRSSRKPYKQGYWPDEKKLQIVTLFASGVTANMDLSRLTKVPESTIRTFKHSEWWPEMLEQVYAVMDQETESKQTKIVNTTLDALQDRLQDGDYVLSKKGEIHRKPINGKDLSQIHSVMIDKRQLLRQRQTKKDTTSTESRLEKLASDFKKFIRAKDITGEAHVIQETQGQETQETPVSEQEVLNDACRIGEATESTSPKEETQGQTV